MSNETEQQNVLQKFLTNMNIIAKAYERAAELNTLTLDLKYTASIRGSNLSGVYDVLSVEVLDDIDHTHDTIFNTAVKLLGGALDHNGVEILQESGLSKETLKKHAEGIVMSIKSLGYDIPNALSDFLGRPESYFHTKNQNDDFAMRQS